MMGGTHIGIYENSQMSNRKLLSSYQKALRKLQHGNYDNIAGDLEVRIAFIKRQIDYLQSKRN